MDVLTNTHINIPLPQIAILLLASTLLFIYGKTLLALMITYGFLFYWGYIAKIDDFFNYRFESIPEYAYYYFVFGFIIFLFVSFGYFMRKEH